MLGILISESLISGEGKEGEIELDTQGVGVLVVGPIL